MLLRIVSTSGRAALTRLSCVVDSGYRPPNQGDESYQHALGVTHLLYALSYLKARSSPALLLAQAACCARVRIKQASLRLCSSTSLFSTPNPRQDSCRHQRPASSDHAISSRSFVILRSRPIDDLRDDARPTASQRRYSCGSRIQCTCCWKALVRRHEQGKHKSSSKGFH